MSERYVYGSGEKAEAPDVDAFLTEVLGVCRKHNMSIGHEDSQGGFLVSRGYDEEWSSWLNDASLLERKP